MNSDISQATARPSSYLETENLETQERIINLGKRLLTSFQHNNPDEITVWMINYLAEQIDLAESTSCSEAKKRCFETIIKLWESRSNFPNGTRPFENLEQIFLALDSLSPERTIPRYVNNNLFEENYSQETEKLTNWLETSKMLDSTARILISFMLEQAVQEADTDETLQWIETISGVVESQEVNFIARLYGEQRDSKQEKIKNLKKHIEQLELFEEVSRLVKQNLENECQMVD
ncbi:hypothetical protein JCM30760_22310 [Thiomicrorhabdus hydrogeniphila]